MSTTVFSVRRRDLAWSLALIVLLTTVWVVRSDPADAGGTPPGQGIALVYIAVGTGFADALGVGPGAGVNGAPIIIVPTNPPLDSATAAELVRLDPRTVIIIGGTAVVSDAMESTIAALLPFADLSRIAGTNRYKTNAAFSAATFPIEGWASVPAGAFTGQIPATDDVLVGTVAANNTAEGNLFAPIQLPHGAEILEFRAGVSDSNDTVDITVTLHRVATTANWLMAASVGTAGFDGGDVTLSTMTITPGAEIVDNENYAYYVQVTDTAFGDGPFVITVMVRYRLGASTG